MSEISSVGIVGAGSMGAGIAESAAAGVKVALYEPIPGGIERSRQSTDASLARSVNRGKHTESEPPSYSTAYRGRTSATRSPTRSS